MKSRRSLLVALTLVIVTADAHAQAPATHTTIRGRVVAEATGQPVRRAYVIVHGPDTKTTRVTMSDGEGAFRFEGLPADRCRVGAEKWPYLSDVADAVSGTVVVSLGSGAVMTGHVVEQPGQTPGRVAVHASSAALPSPQTTRTNLHSEFRLPWRLTTEVFVQMMLGREQWRYSYYRQCFEEKLRRFEVALPVTKAGQIDEDAMQSAVETAPYWRFVLDRIDSSTARAQAAPRPSANRRK